MWGRLYCDMDMVLVHQTAREGFHLMPWMPDGRELWDFIKAFNPTLLTQVREDRFGQLAHEKLQWINREIGNVPVIFTPDSRGKGPFARSGDVLIDDAEKHCSDWAKAGGMAFQHKSAKATIEMMRRSLL